MKPLTVGEAWVVTIVLTLALVLGMGAIVVVARATSALIGG